MRFSSELGESGRPCGRQKPSGQDPVRVLPVQSAGSIRLLSGFLSRWVVPPFLPPTQAFSPGILNMLLTVH